MFPGRGLSAEYFFSRLGLSTDDESTLDSRGWHLVRALGPGCQASLPTCSCFPGTRILHGEGVPKELSFILLWTPVRLPCSVRCVVSERTSPSSIVRRLGAVLLQRMRGAAAIIPMLGWPDVPPQSASSEEHADSQAKLGSGRWACPVNCFSKLVCSPVEGRFGWVTLDGAVRGNPTKGFHSIGYVATSYSVRVESPRDKRGGSLGADRLSHYDRNSFWAGDLGWRDLGSYDLGPATDFPTFLHPETSLEICPQLLGWVLKARDHGESISHSSLVARDPERSTLRDMCGRLIIVGVLTRWRLSVARGLCWKLTVSGVKELGALLIVGVPGGLVAWLWKLWQL